MRGRLLLLTLVLGACAGDGSRPVYAARPVPLAVLSGKLAVADLEGDGSPELISLVSGAVAIRPLLDGRFDTATVRTLPGPRTDGGGTAGLVLADLDGDGRQDLATGVPTRSAIAFLPDLTAGNPVREIAVDAAVRDLVAGDVDGDGLTDLVASVRDRDELLLLRGGPDGPKLVQRIPFAEPDALVVVDLDGDGRSGVATASYASGVVRLLTPVDAGLEPGPHVWQTPFPAGLTAADLDGDGLDDLAAVDQFLRLVWVGLSDGHGGWRSRNNWELDVEPAGLLARRGPDGPELVVSGSDCHSVLLVDPLTGVTRVGAATQGTHGSLLAADLDGDGIDELVHGDGVLRDAPGDPLRASGARVGPATGLIVRVDLDGDGNEELVVEELGHDELVVYGSDGPALAELTRAPAPPDLAGLHPL